jgi:hypothetical protein
MRKLSLYEKEQSLSLFRGTLAEYCFMWEHQKKYRKGLRLPVMKKGRGLKALGKQAKTRGKGAYLHTQSKIV